jgi:hypothetical protein
MSDDCKAESATKKFCSIRANPKCGDCKQPKTYIEVCKPKGWGSYPYIQMVDGAKTEKKFEAHHILCVSPVTKELAGKTSIKKAIEETDWCINNGKNMIAMPLWGHTVKWYCKITKSREFLPKRVPAPPFKNLPQHNIDHNSSEGYTYEIKVECQRLTKKILDSKHKLKADALVDELNELSDDWRDEIKRRGAERKGGTHEAWKSAWGEDPDPDWFEPFSMASDDKISEMPFPVHKFDEKVAAWIDRLANTMAP